MHKRPLFSRHAREKENGGRRDYEIQRIETFSDGVFAFAVTLLIVSLQVPQNFDELLTNMRGFFAFGISFAVLVSIWTEQHKFFRNYGLDDGWTIALNGALLFIVLFYTYPLKFLFTLLFSNQIYGPHKSPLTITAQQMPTLMAIYALGFIAIYSLFFLMYFRANRKSVQLGFTPTEKFDCRSGIYKIAIMVTTGFCALMFAILVPYNYAGRTGLIYLLTSPAMAIFYMVRKKNRKKLFPEAVKAD
jgi:uncharacterized membrane protein